MFTNAWSGETNLSLFEVPEVSAGKNACCKMVGKFLIAERRDIIGDPDVEVDMAHGVPCLHFCCVDVFHVWKTCLFYVERWNCD